MERFKSSSPYEDLIGFARAVRRGSRIVVSGTAPIGSDGETVDGDAYQQAKRCFEIVISRLPPAAMRLVEVLVGVPAGVAPMT